MEYAVITPAWDMEGKFFVIDAGKKQDMIIADHNSSTYAEALPEIEAEILLLFEQYDQAEGEKIIGPYIFRPANEDWYIAEVALK